MNHNLITDKVYEHIAGAMKYLLEDPHDVQQAGVLWGYILALLDVEAITVEEWQRWQILLSTAEIVFNENDLTTELMKKILSCLGPQEVLEIWKEKKGEPNDG